MLMNFTRPTFQLDKIVDDLINDRWTHAMSERQKNVFAPTDIYEMDGKIRLMLELPGVSKENVNVEIKENKLSITGHKTQTENTDGTSYYRTERVFGDFTRSFELSKDLDASNIDAEFKDGVLRIDIPKIVPAEPEVRSIEIK